MANKEIQKCLNEMQKVADAKKKADFLYLSPCMPFSFQGISNFVFTAVRGMGKSVISVETAIILKRHPDMRLFSAATSDGPTCL